MDYMDASISIFNNLVFNAENLFLSLLDYFQNLPVYIKGMVYVFLFLYFIFLVKRFFFKRSLCGIRYKNWKQRSMICDALDKIKLIKQSDDHEGLRILNDLDGFTFEILMLISAVKNIQPKRKSHVSMIKLTGDFGLDGHFCAGDVLYIIQSKCYKVGNYIQASHIMDLSKIAKRMVHSKNKNSLFNRTKAKSIIPLFLCTGSLSEKSRADAKNNSVVLIDNLSIVKFVKGEHELF